MTTYNEMSDFYNSAIYFNVIRDVRKKNHIEVDMDSGYKESHFEIDQDILSKADLTLGDIKQILSDDSEEIIKFILKKMSYFLSIEDDNYLGEIPEGEEVEIEDSKTVHLPFKKSFLLLYIVEYFLLKNTSDKLFDYIKARRIPQAKKYEKELKGIYNKL